MCVLVIEMYGISKRRYSHNFTVTTRNISSLDEQMVLAGLRPEIIMDVTNHALTFWQYQMYQELEYQKSMVKQCGSKISRVEENYENQITKLKNDLQKERRNKEGN